MTISENLKRIRTERGYKQEQVAEALGISRSTYTNFENGRNPDIELLMKLADIYGMPLDTLAGRNFRFGGASLPIQHDDEFRKRMLWRSHIRNRKTENTLLFMFYLLNATRAHILLKEVEDTLQEIMSFVIRNVYLHLYGKNTDASKDGMKLSVNVTNKLYSLCTEMNNQLSDEPHFYDRVFTPENLSDPEEIKRYFRLNLTEIIGTDSGQDNL